MRGEGQRVILIEFPTKELEMKRLRDGRRIRCQPPSDTPAGRK